MIWSERLAYIPSVLEMRNDQQAAYNLLAYAAGFEMLFFSVFIGIAFVLGGSFIASKKHMRVVNWGMFLGFSILDLFCFYYWRMHS